MSADFSPEFRAELLDDFYAEADEYLDNIRTQLTALEIRPKESAADPAVIESLFRSVHSFKGISAMAGLKTAEELAHRVEGYLRQLTTGKRDLTDPGLESLISSALRLEQLVGAHRLKQPAPAVTDLLRQFETTDDHAPVESGQPAVVSVVSRVSAPDPLQLLQSRGLAPWRCTFLPSRELDQRGININAVRARIATVGEIVSATPSVRPEGSIAFDFVLGLREIPTDLTAWERDGLFLHAMVPDPAPLIMPAGAAAAPSGPVAQSLFVAPSHIVRVDLSRLDELMRITGEMVIHRSRLEERINGMRGDTTSLNECSQSLARSLRQMRTALTRVRLVPIAEIFTRMPFVVRDLSRESGKQVRLVLEGQQTEIDKYLVERLKEPLLHLVRNAFSHGVEPPAERLAVGKSAEATIWLRANVVGESVVIRVCDDGRGVDRDKVAARAAEIGLAVPQPLDDAGVLALLSQPGFSTRDEADRAAGRGVGMSVVQNTLREVGGSVTLESTPGRRTEFTLRLPLTLSIAETVIVSVGDQTCAVPLNCVDEIIQLDESAVRTIDRTEVVPYRDGVLPVVRLRAMLGERGSARPQLSILVLNSERGSTGLIVDRVHTQREVVVRPLRDPLLHVSGVSGATELGDGRLILILDAVAITRGVVRPRATSAATTN